MVCAGCSDAIGPSPLHVELREIITRVWTRPSGRWRGTECGSDRQWRVQVWGVGPGLLRRRVWFFRPRRRALRCGTRAVLVSLMWSERPQSHGAEIRNPFFSGRTVVFGAFGQSFCHKSGGLLDARVCSL